MNCLGKVLDVWNVSIYVICYHHINIPIRFNYSLRDNRTKKIIDNVYTRVFYGTYDIIGWINTNYRADVLLNQRSKQNAIIAPNFDYRCLFGY
jgi:hypothetical protein